MSNRNVRVSAVIPNYNGAKYLPKAIDSFLAQDYENKELVIVDGKSTDSSHEIIKKYVSENQNIVWITEPDTGLTDAFNIGIKHATGDFISFLSCDVYYYTNDVFSCINYNYQLIPFDCIYFDNYIYNGVNKKIWLNKCPNVQMFDRNNLLRNGPMVNFDNAFISSKLYARHKLNPAYNLCSDWEVFLRLATEEEVASLYVEKIASINIQDGENMSLKYAEQQMAEVKAVAALYNVDNVKPFFDNSKTFAGKVKDAIKNVVNIF